MNTNRLKHLYVEELKDIYNAETQLTKALPKMAKAASDPDLRAGFTEHLEQTKQHVSRLEQIFKALSESPKGKKCKGMEGLIEEGSEMIEEDIPDDERDAGLISAAQRVEHYEIAAYGCVRTYATLLGEEDAAELLSQTEQEEKETDRKLSDLAQNINIQAANSEEGEESDSHKRLPRKAAKARAARA